MDFDLVGYERLIKVIDTARLLSLPGDLLEIGTFLGGGAAKLSRFLAGRGSSKKLFVVDIFDHCSDATVNAFGVRMNDLYSYYLREAASAGFGTTQWEIYSRTTSESSNIVTLRGDSMTVLIPTESLCFAFIDGSHEAEHVMHDCKLAWSRLTYAGVLAVHDYGGDLPGVTETIDSFVAEIASEIVSMKILPGSILLIRKTWTRSWSTRKPMSNARR